MLIYMDGVGIDYIEFMNVDSVLKITCSFHVIYLDNNPGFTLP